MDIENTQEKVHQLLGRPISCVEFQQNGRTRYLPIYLNYAAMKDASVYVGDTEQECYEKLFIDLTKLQASETT